jgi:flavorubredoxin
MSDGIGRRTVVKGASAAMIMALLRGGEGLAAPARSSARPTGVGGKGARAFHANQTITTLVPDRLYRIGCVVRGQRLSWLPADIDGYEPLNAYLLTDKDNCIFVDTGSAIMLPAIKSALEIIGDRKVWVYFTRNEAETIGNLGYLLGTCENPTMLFGSAGGVLEWVNDPAVSILEVRNFLGRIPVESARNGVKKDVGTFGFSFMEAVTKQMGMTQWAYEKSTATLFTACSFGWRHLATVDSPTVVETALNLPSVDSVAREMVAKANWMREANFQERIDMFEQVFRDYDVEMLAPNHGSVIRGRKAVAAHVKHAVNALHAASKLPDTERLRYV